MTQPINLADLSAPDVVEPLDYEGALAEMLAHLRDLNPAYTATVESDPLYAELEATAYRELLLRNRVNQAAKSVMLPHAVGGDLDNLGALFNVVRLVVTPADDTQVPPREAVMEDDPSFRRRIQLKLEAVSTAGSRESYIFHALSASANVRDAAALSPNPCEVDLIIMARGSGGHADQPTQTAVADAISAEKVRPLGDRVTVRSANIIDYAITAKLYIATGPDAELVRQSAVGALEKLLNVSRPIGFDIRRSALFAALHQPGVVAVNLTEPAADIAVGNDQAASLTTLNISAEIVS